jgi:SAM-dependent methyltransferase
MDDSSTPLDPRLRATLSRLGDEGWDLWVRFDQEIRRRRWHSFVPAEYDRVLAALVALRQPGLRFLEWGSATGIVTIMADLLGYDASGIELDEELVDLSLEVARRYRSRARFVAGSFLPEGYAWRPRGGDARLGTVGEGASGYLRLGRALDDFDLVYAYPWGGEEPMMQDLMRMHGAPGAGLLLHRMSGDVELLRGGRLERSWTSGPSAGSGG